MTIKVTDEVAGDAVLALGWPINVAAIGTNIESEHAKLPPVATGH